MIAEPSSPVDSALFRRRRARAFFGRDKASSFAESLSVEFIDAKSADAEDLTTNLPHVTHCGGCTQEELDELCVDEGSTEAPSSAKNHHAPQRQYSESTEESDDDKLPYPIPGQGFTQEELDALCVVECSIEAAVEGSLQSHHGFFHELPEPSSPVGSALLRIRRARAFSGHEEASLLAERIAAEFHGTTVACVEDTSTNLPYASPTTGFKQEELDALCVDECSIEADVEGSLQSHHGVSDEVPEPSSPVGSALLRIRRARAFSGHEEASLLAERIAAEFHGATVACVEDTSTNLPCASPTKGFTQEELDALCVDECSIEADVEGSLQSHQGVSDDVPEPSSPVGSALLRIRRARAFSGHEKASLLAERIAAEFHGASIASVDDTSTNLPCASPTTGFKQEELDALCVDEGSTEEDEDKLLHATTDQDDGSTEESEEDKDTSTAHSPGKAAAGLEQEVLDELGVENTSSDSDAGEAESQVSKSNAAILLATAALKRGVLGAEAIKLKDDNDIEIDADSFDGDALLMRVRRLRAFRGQSEARRFAETLCSKAETTAQTPMKPRPSRLDVQGLSEPRATSQKEPSVVDSPVLKVASPLRKRQVW